jgi:vacuolar protein sorting-associated protein 52
MHAHEHTHTHAQTHSFILTRTPLTHNKVNLGKRTDSFSLGERDKILDRIEEEPILLHVAVAESLKYPMEAIFRSIIKHLSDAATNEFLFVIDFFKSNTRETFNKMFGRTLSSILEFLENYLLNCYDAIGLLLVIKVTHLQRLVMQRRRIPVLDPFFDRVSMLLWPRFKQVFDLNLKSVKSANPRKLGPIDLSPHYVSKRYAELVSSVFFLQTGSESMGVGGGGENMLQHDIHAMRTEMGILLDKLSTLIPNQKEQKVFYINNFDQILGVFQERRVVSEEVQKFQDILLHQREIFAEEEIRSAFPKLISFVVQTEQAIASVENMQGGVQGSVTLDDALVEGLVRDFSVNWRSGIQQINDNVLAYFANFRNGMEILKQVLTQLLLYYSRFQEIIKKSWSRPPAFSRDIISTATILMEIKRYSRTF